MSDEAVWTRLRAQKRAAEEAERQKAAEPLPAPSVTACEPPPGILDSCRSARLAVKAASAAHCLWTLTYARGPLIGAGDRVLDLEVESLMLKAVRPDGGRLSAVWFRRPGADGWELSAAYGGTHELGRHKVPGGKLGAFLKAAA